ncbi:PREDICTED: intraflagellar transport protein 57 homolog [Priapulus caudatus]|uniref:Intraflagellar transport protein 57 homolog n=1 Tax=Priapulus caudatus TaxID=37621 RepID=A0ABM1EHQ3_PRICU|nr:PREDICTED: intraflagellar transport protein 57 homolog [Priapulus caudatus]
MTDHGRQEDAADMEDGGPGAVYQIFVTMEELQEKLKILNYETEVTKNRHIGLKPISKHYFVIQTNPGEQFFMFVSIAAMLIRMCGKQFPQPSEDDDPNNLIADILAELRNLGHSISFSPSKLKSGYGELVVQVLDKLANEALKLSNHTWKQPVYPTEEAEEEIVTGDDAEVTLNKVEEEMAEEEDLEEEESILDLNALRGLNQANDMDHNKPEEILESVTDAAEWKLEVERVLPSLKVHIRTDNKDWRSHLEQMHQHRDGIESTLAETKGYLDKLHSEISRTLEKISSREKYINTQLEHFLLEYRTLQDKLAETKEKYRQASGGVTERNQTLQEITEELERVKQDMEERGTYDASPCDRTEINNRTDEMESNESRSADMKTELSDDEMRQSTTIEDDRISTDDDSSASPLVIDIEVAKRAAAKMATFPEKLWTMLSYKKDGSRERCLRWSSSGRYVVIDVDAFEKMSTKDFPAELVGSGKLITFVRKMYLYGFKKMAEEISVGHDARANKKRYRELKTAVTLAIVVIVYVLSWAPMIIIRFLNFIYAGDHRYDVLVPATIATCNSFCNPFIYALRSAKFRRAYRRVLCCGTDRCKPDSDTQVFSMDATDS